jgi:hypothetical protein
MDIPTFIIYCLLIYLLCIISCLIIAMICGAFKLVYDCMKYYTVNDNFILGFINIKNKEINPV